MNIRNLLIPLGLIVLIYMAYDAVGWKGVAGVVGGITMWSLLHFTRLMTVMRRAANRPIGYVGSAVMLNVKLKPKVNLMHVVAMTRSLGERLSEEGQDPEIYRWVDGTESSVTCEFVQGRLMKWTLQRPQQPEKPQVQALAENHTPAPTTGL